MEPRRDGSRETKVFTEIGCINSADIADWWSGEGTGNLPFGELQVIDDLERSACWRGISTNEAIVGRMARR